MNRESKYSMRSKPPIFIIGNPRSGTTLLRLMLTCHSNICVPPEGGWLVNLYKKYRYVTLSDEYLESFVRDVLVSPKIEGWNLDYSGLLTYLKKEQPTSYAALASCVYRYYAIQYQSGKQRWGDKNNFYLNHIQTINALFPAGLFLHIIRDGRDIACSYRDLAGIKSIYAPNLPTGVCGAAVDWVTNINTIQRGFRTIDTTRIHLIHYENLVRQPKETLQAICTFLDEPYDENMLAFAEINRQVSLEPDMFMSWKKRTKKSVTAQQVGRWKQELSQDDQFLFQLIGKQKLVSYGYEIASPKIGFLRVARLRVCAAAVVLFYRMKQLTRKLKRAVKRLYNFLASFKMFSKLLNR